MSSLSEDAAAGPFAVECPGCRAHVAVARALAGAAAACPLCRAIFLAPTPSVPESVAIPTAHTASPAPTAAADEPLVFTEPPRPGTPWRGDGFEAGAVERAPSAVPVDGGFEFAVPPPASTRDEPAGLAFHEPVKTIKAGDAAIELRRLTPEERHARRARRNLVMLVIGAALLVALVVILGTGKR